MDGERCVQGDPLAPFLFIIVAEGLNGLMRQAALKGEFVGFRFNADPMIEVSLLQFADDTLFIGDASMKNIFVIKSVLRCFELVAGLKVKVNFHKSRIGGVGVVNNSLLSFASMLNCSLMQLPFIYLGLPIGGNPRRCRFGILSLISFGRD